MGSGYRVRTNRGVKLEAVPLEELARLLTDGAIDIDTPIKDLSSGRVFFPEQHPQLRAVLDPSDMALREPLIPRQWDSENGSTEIYLHLRNALIAVSVGVLVVVTLVVSFYPHLQ